MVQEEIVQTPQGTDARVVEVSRAEQEYSKRRGERIAWYVVGVVALILLLGACVTLIALVGSTLGAIG